MFGIFASQERRMRSTATGWIELAQRVWHQRRDLLSEAAAHALLGRTEDLRTALRDKADTAKLKLQIERLEEVLREAGGRVYPKSSLVENVEFFLVAAIVILGIRTYFVQPFKIPTNSMWPSYYGMTPQVYPDPADAPGPLMRILRFAMLGATHYEVVAPVSGPISIPVTSGSPEAGGGRVEFQEATGRRWYVLPAKKRQYIFYIGNTPVTFEVPYDFDFDIAFREAFGVTAEQISAAANRSMRASGNARWVTLDRDAEAGKAFLSFDILTGDQLFVDRISYHFVRPKVGQGFVFRTGNIPGIAEKYGDQYYIKRLVGEPGDTLEIRQPVLYRNGQPITGSAAFEKNNNEEGKYRGYFYGPGGDGYLAQGETLTVPRDKYFAMGDNSGNSLDGRYWGFVPKKDVVGRPMLIYYPFTSRWLKAP